MQIKLKGKEIPEHLKKYFKPSTGCNACHICHAVLVSREVYRVLRPDGVFWLNYGDSYATSKNGRSAKATKAAGKDDRTFRDKPFSVIELPAKNLIGMPWRVALALQDDGWILRSDIIWSKTNPMPESVEDRPTKSHEYIFMLTKSPRYFYDAEAVRESGKEWSGQAGTFNRTNGKNTTLTIPGQSRPSHRGRDDRVAPGRNLRSVWTIPTESYSSTTKYDRAIEHYVGGDGSPYRVSTDCPIHSPRLDPQKSETLAYDGQQEAPESGNLDTGIGHVQEPSFEPLATIGPDNQDDRLSRLDSSGLETSRLQTPESIGDYRSEAGHPARISDVKNQSRTSRTLESDDAQDHKRDSEDQENLLSATGHNIQTHRTGRALVTSPLDNASAQTTFHTGDTPTLPLPSDLVGHTSENNTLGDSSLGASDSDPLEQTVSRNGDKSILPLDNYTCTCQKVKTDHYATFPRKLVEPMILAGTSAKGVCPECGAPWKRITERRKAEITRPRPFSKDGNGDRNDTLRVYEEHDRVTTGWQPTCKCIQKRAPNPSASSGHGFGMKGSELLELADEVAKEFAPIPAVIFDPFCGSGTVGQVARELGRRFIGIDLSAKYLAENALPRSEKKMSQSALGQLPLFAPFDGALQQVQDAPGGSDDELH